MRLSRKAKASLEYIAIGTIVVLGIALGGPLAIEGFNSMFKAWDDSAQTTFADPFVKAPPKCVCTPWVNQSCGTFGCTALQYARTRTCTPTACKHEQECLTSSSCCTVAQLICNPPGDVSCCGLNASSPGPCFWQDQGVKQWQCGGQTPQRACQNDGRCHFQCVNQPPSPPNTMCPGDNVSLRGPSLDIASTLVPHQRCTTGRKCEWEQPCTGTVRVFEGRTCSCWQNRTTRVPLGHVAVRADCPSGYEVVGGWCDFVQAGTNTPVGGALTLGSGKNANGWTCGGYYPGISSSTTCRTGCPGRPELRVLAHCWPTCRTTPRRPWSVWQAEGSCSFRIWFSTGCRASQRNPWCWCTGQRYCTHHWDDDFPCLNATCPLPNARKIDLCRYGLNISGHGSSIQVRSGYSARVCNHYLAPGDGRGIYMTINNAPGTIHFCYKNNRTYFRQTPPRCQGFVAAWNAPTPVCPGQLKPLVSFLTEIGGTTSSLPRRDGNDRKVAICCDFENYPFPCYPPGQC